MRKLLFLLFASAASLVSCNQNSSKKVAEKFLNSFYHMDYKTAKEVSTEETKKVLDFMEQLSTVMPDSQKQQAKQIKIDIKDVKETGDKATVEYETSNTKGVQKLNLVKTSGKWLVNWSKQDEMGAEAQPAEEPQMSDTTAPPAQETIGVPTAADTAIQK
jgi:hypothetical protein